MAALITITVGPILIDQVPIPNDLTAWVLSALSEMAIGAVLGCSAALIVAGARQAGELVGSQAGLSAAALFDPEAGEEMTPLGHLYGLIAVGVFLSLDGPLLVIRALLESYTTWPVGGFSLSAQTADLLFGKVSESLALALRAAAPAAAALTMAGLALALMARAAPSLPFAALALPIRSMLGLILVALGLTVLIGTLTETWRDWLLHPF